MGMKSSTGIARAAHCAAANLPATRRRTAKSKREDREPATAPATTRAVKLEPKPAQERRLEIGRERTEPVDDVAVEQLPARQRVRHDPLAARIDERVGPLAAGDDEEKDGSGRREDRSEATEQRADRSHGATSADHGASVPVTAS